MAAGDVLPHRRVKASAAQAGWDAVFAGIADRVRAADVAFANLESPVAPDAHMGIHGEVFNAPADLPAGLAAAGFDVVSLANNHAWDQGAAGLIETRARVASAGLVSVGAGATCAHADGPVRTEVNGVRIAWLAFADLLNLDGRTGPDAACVSVAGPLCTVDCLPDRDALFFRADAAALAARVRAAREGADLVVVSAHWGDEYRTSPLPEYPALAQVLVDAGADLILAHHPHVLQPVRRLRASDGRDAIVAFSLGNLVSDMGRTYTLADPVKRGDTRDGALLEVTVELGPEGTRLNAVVVPTWTTNGEWISVGLTERLEPTLRELRTARVREVVGPDVPVASGPPGL